MVTNGLRRWFVVHCIVDVLFAVPLLVAPEFALGILGWGPVDPVATRLVAAALFGIGIESYIGRNGSLEVFRGMLNLKVLWSAFAIVGLAWSWIDGGPPAVGLFLGIFVAFNILWTYYRIQVGKAVQTTS